METKHIRILTLHCTAFHRNNQSILANKILRNSTDLFLQLKTRIHWFLSWFTETVFFSKSSRAINNEFFCVLSKIVHIKKWRLLNVGVNWCKGRRWAINSSRSKGKKKKYEYHELLFNAMPNSKISKKYLPLWNVEIANITIHFLNLWKILRLKDSMKCLHSFWQIHYLSSIQRTFTDLTLARQLVHPLCKTWQWGENVFWQVA